MYSQTGRKEARVGWVKRQIQIGVVVNILLIVVHVRMS